MFYGTAIMRLFIRYDYTWLINICLLYFDIPLDCPIQSGVVTLVNNLGERSRKRLIASETSWQRPIFQLYDFFSAVVCPSLLRSGSSFIHAELDPCCCRDGIFVLQWRWRWLPPAPAASGGSGGAVDDRPSCVGDDRWSQRRWRCDLRRSGNGAVLCADPFVCARGARVICFS